MPSFKTTAMAAIALFVSSQAQYVIDPTTVDINTRLKWCESQVAVCPLLCLQLPGQDGTTVANTCDAPTLSYSCICGNGLTPNVTEYSLTLPYFICVQWQEQCVAGCGNGATACQSSCRQDHPCGALNPTRVNTTSTSSSVAATETGSRVAATGSAEGTGTVYNGFGGGATATPAAAGSSSTAAPKSGAPSALDLGRSYGIMAVMTGLFAGFALVL